MEKKIITESELRSIVRESIAKILKENQEGILLEMALPRKTYKKRISDIIPQLLENWCLVRYATIHGNVQQKQHWQTELRGHFLTMSRFSITGNDTPVSRLKVFQEIWREEDLNLPETLNLVIANKFMSEGISIKSEEYGQVLYDCIGSTNKIYEIIIGRDIDAITQYVETI